MTNAIFDVRTAPTVMLRKGVLLRTGVLTLFTVLESCRTIYFSPTRLLAEAISKEPYDAIIVPGYPYTGERFNKRANARVLWSYYLVEQGVARHVIYTGSAVYTEYTEAKIMALYGECLGIPSNQILLEEQAEFSAENLYYSVRLAKQNGFKRIALATDERQTAKLIHFINKYRLEVDLIPIVDQCIMEAQQYFGHVDPGLAQVGDFVSIIERYSMLDRLRGNRGKRVDFATIQQ